MTHSGDSENRELSWYQLCRRCWPRSASENKVVITTTLSFQCLGRRFFLSLPRQHMSIYITFSWPKHFNFERVSTKCYSINCCKSPLCVMRHTCIRINHVHWVGGGAEFGVGWALWVWKNDLCLPSPFLWVALGKCYNGYWLQLHWQLNTPEKMNMCRDSPGI